MENLTAEQQETVSSTLPTPIPYAGFWARVGASFLDTLILSPILGLTFYNLFVLKSFALMVGISILVLLYKPTMEALCGATLGKMALKIKVVNQQEEKISIVQAIMRNIIFLLPALVSLLSNIQLYLNPDFIEAESLIEIGLLQQHGPLTVISPIVSTLAFISCLVVAFNKKKQGLHDMIGVTYNVIK